MSSMKEATHAAPAPPAAGTANGDAGPIPYIGSRISLISKSAIRYEGTLYTIDTNESTVALQNVRSFGTEGRARPGGPIPPTPEVYEYIIFRGPDILDLQVLRTEVPKPTPLYHDPAIVSSATATPPPPVQAHAAGVSQGLPQPRPANGAGSAREQHLPQQAQRPAQPPKPVEKKPANPAPAPTLASWGPPPPSSEWGPPPQPSNKQPYRAAQPMQAEERKREGASSSSNWRVNPEDSDRGRERGNNGFGDVRRGDGRDGGGRSAQPRYQDANGGGGGRPAGRGGRGHGGRGRRQRRRGPGITVPDEDFDFESMHQKFDKASLSEEAHGFDDGGLGAPPVAVKYDKSKGFFDELVPEKQMPRERSNAAQRRATDMETFGEAGSSYRYRNYRGRGRRGGGGGGRGRRNKSAFRKENAE